MSDWENEIVIQITEEGAKSTETALKSISKEYKKLQDLAKQPLSPLGGAGAAADNNFAKAFSPQEFKKATTALSQFGIEYEKIGKTIRSPLSGGEDRFASMFTKAGSGIDALNPKVNTLKSNFTEAAQAVRIFRTLVIATGIEKFVSEIVHTVDTLTNMQNKILVVSDSLNTAKAAFYQLTQIAMDNRSSLESVATVYSRTSRSVKDLGYSASETLRFTKILSQAVMVGGSTAVEASNAMIQLSQGMASGTLKGDELRSVLEQLPVVAQLIAHHMNVSVGELRKLGLQGKLTTTQVFDAIVEGEKDMAAQFAKTTPTFEQGWEVFKTSVTSASKIFQPLVASMSQGMIDLAKNIKDIPVVMDVLAKNFKENSEGMHSSWLGSLWDDLDVTGAAGDAAMEMLPIPIQLLLRAGKKGLEPRVNKLGSQIDQAKIDEKNMADMMLWMDPRDAALPKKKGPPPEPKKEGGLTWQELIFKSQQENEIAGQEPFNQGVTKEFFQKMQSLKDSIRDDLVKNAGKQEQGGKLRLLQEMITAEHERISAQHIQLGLEQELYEMEQERLEKSIELGKKEQETRAKNTQQVEASDRAVTAALNPFEAYNKEIEKFNDYLFRHPENKSFVEEAVLKMGYAYTTFAPIFNGVSASIADAAANSLIFGDNMHKALTQIAKDLTARSLSALFQMGFNAIIGTPMAGINGGASFNPGSGGGAGGVFASGGYTGGGSGRGDVAGVVHGQEFVVNANATARNRAMLESMNAGRPVGGGGANVTVHNYAGASVETSTNDDGSLEIRINKAIANQAPRIIAADLRNPNSRTSKALSSTYDVPRRN